VRARMLRSPLWPASLLVGLCVLTASCGASTPARAVPSPTPTPLPSPTATVSPTATAAPLANVDCDALNSIPYVHLPGPLPTTIPVPPGTVVLQYGFSYPGDATYYHFCTPKATHATITAYMDAALPAAGWRRQSIHACNAPSYDWYKGIYGIDLLFSLSDPPDDPQQWALNMCAHVGQE
jgi:hypothetical protein